MTRGMTERQDLMSLLACLRPQTTVEVAKVVAASQVRASPRALGESWHSSSISKSGYQWCVFFAQTTGFVVAKLATCELYSCFKRLEKTRPTRAK